MIHRHLHGHDVTLHQFRGPSFHRVLKDAARFIKDNEVEWVHTVDLTFLDDMDEGEQYAAYVYLDL